MRYFVIALLAIAFCGLSAFHSNNSTVSAPICSKLELIPMPFSVGGQQALTGAPGEFDCTQCHAGTALIGDDQNILTLVNSDFTPVSSYIPGETYTVTLTLSSSPSKKGFSATVLNSVSDEMAGSFTGSAIGGTQQFENEDIGREYVSNTSVSNTDNTVLWAWTWTAPETNEGEVTFYIASVQANDNGATSGDETYLSEHEFSSTVGISKEEEEEPIHSFNVNYSSVENSVVVEFTSLITADLNFSLIDLNGKSILTKNLSPSIIGRNTQNVPLPSIENGIYIVTCSNGTATMSQKVLIQR